MKFVIQRVNHAEVKVDGEIVGKIGKGFLVLIGVGREDTKEDADWYLKKLLGLRIFEDENGKTNLSLADVNGELLLVSQFTLYANCRKGNRPSFIEAGAPDEANKLYEYIISEAGKQVPVVEHGIFGADMKVSLENDGPFTVIFDEKYQEICQGCSDYDLPVHVDGLIPEEVLSATKKDKKMEQGHIRFILMDGIGKSFIDKTVTDEELLSCIQEITL